MKHNMVNGGIPTGTMESLTADRQLWSSVSASGIQTFEHQHHDAKHPERKNSDKKMPVEASFTCSNCDHPCGTRIKLYRHSRSHSNSN